VLAEKETVGRTEQFAEVFLDQPVEPGALVRAAITGSDGTHLIGRIERSSAC
jgi:threonylcarbamoyladenosine tRNA methylthiotransferase MtaB